MSGFFFQSSGTPHNLCKDTFETMVHMVVEWGKNASMFEKQTIGLFHGLNLFLVVHVIGDIMRMRIMELIYI